ncbi:protease IV [Gammaproteobacteria bacterium]
MTQETQPSTPAWERDTINRLAFAALNEQRRSRRWGVFFKILIFVYLFALLSLYLWSEGKSLHLGGRHTSLVEIKGVISDGTDANADDIIAGLRAAFEDTDTAGVVVRINSPGGSPVQAGYINDEIWRLRKKYPSTSLYAVISDVCASGGYYIAAAAEKIYADKGSIVGSIGVRMDSFGFVEALQKLGIERRLLTAGEHKGFLDPFLPERPEEIAHVKGVLSEIHNQFIDVVKQGRGDRIKDDPKLFSGLVWTGEQAKSLGLVDEIGSVGLVAREIFNAETVEDYTRRTNFLDRALEHLSSSLARILPQTLNGLVLFR